MGQKFFVINAFLPLGVYRFFMSKRPWMGVVYQTMLKIKKIKQDYFLSENP